MRRVILLVAWALVLSVLSRGVSAAFCCNDTITGMHKCWAIGECCEKFTGAVGGLPEGWYIGCNCSEIGGCKLNAAVKCTKEYDGDVFCCPSRFHWGYNGKYLGVKGYYCNCSSPTSCSWVPFETEVNVWFSNPHPNYGEEIYIYVNATYRDKERVIPPVVCDSTTTRIKKFEVDGNDLTSQVQWDDSNKRWYVKINTIDYHSKVTVELENGDINTTLDTEGEFDVNFPPNITDVSHSPEPADVDSQVTFEATITDPDEGDSVDTAKVCYSLQKVGVSYECDGEYCTMSNTGGDRYSCTIPLSSLGTGTHEYYIWANDTHGFADISGPYEFTVRNITVESLSVAGNTSSITVTGSGIKYDNGTLVEGSATCWINIDTANDCDVSIVCLLYTSPSPRDRG